MTECWTLKSKYGRLSAYHVCGSLHELKRKVVGTYYTPDALRTDWRYRELFEAELKEALERSGDTMVKIRLVEIETPQPR